MKSLAYSPILPCKSCRIIKNIEDFYLNNKTTCKKCVCKRSANRVRLQRKVFASRAYATRKYERAKKRSINKNVPFDISIDYIHGLLKKKRKCAYCFYNKAISLDRKIPRLGYVKDNIILCCNICNTIKGNWLEYDEMIEIGNTLNLIYKKRLAN